MKTLKRAIAAILAAASSATLAISTAPVLAYASAAESREALINSYSNPTARLIAEYLLDNGMPFDEAKEMTDGYAERHPVSSMARAASVETTVDGPYHNSHHLSGQEHYLVAIVKDTSVALDESFTFDFDSYYVGYDDDAYECGMYANDPNLIYSVGVPQSNKVVTAIYTPNRTTTPSVNSAVKYAVDKAHSANERNLIDHIHFTYNYGHNVIDYDTYALGDVNHDGHVNQKDSDYILEYLVHRRSDFSFTYTDQSTNPKTAYAAVTNLLAADVTKDGVISMADITRLGQWINANNDGTLNDY